VPDRLELALLAALSEHTLQLGIRTKVISHAVLALGQHEHELACAGRHRLLGGPLDHRPVEHRQQLFGQRFGGR